jgi:hypothetical protein
MNTQIEFAESVTLVRKLIDRTREAKLSWQIAEPSLGFCGIDATSAESQITRRFAAQLDSGQYAVVGQSEDGFLEFSLIEHDPRWEDSSPITAISGFEPPLSPDLTAIRVLIEKDPSYGFDTQEESDLSKLLVNLHELARRSAFQINASVGKAISYLDQLAG